MKIYEAVAKTAEEAVEEVIRLSGHSIDDLNIEIEEPKSGLFGFLKQKEYKVKASLKETISGENEISSDVLEEEKENTEYVSKEEETIIREFFQEMSKTIKRDLNVELRSSAKGILVNVTGDDLSILIGKRGRTLDSIRYILSLMINKDRNKDNLRRVSLDVEGYRRKRNLTLERLAKNTAKIVLKTGTEQKLDVMNSYDRRIIHSTLQKNKQVITKSVGDEPNRYVVVHLK